jgi:hypothetical protein
MEQIALARAAKLGRDLEEGKITQGEYDAKMAKDQETLTGARKLAADATDKYNKSLEKSKDNASKIAKAEKDLAKKKRRRFITS